MSVSIFFQVVTTPVFTFPIVIVFVILLQIANLLDRWLSGHDVMLIWEAI